MKSWNIDRADEIESLTGKGIVPFVHELQQAKEKEEDFDVASAFPLLMGQVAGAVSDIKPAKEIVDEMVEGVC